MKNLELLGASKINHCLIVFLNLNMKRNLSTSLRSLSWRVYLSSWEVYSEESFLRRLSIFLRSLFWWVFPKKFVYFSKEFFHLSEESVFRSFSTSLRSQSWKVYLVTSLRSLSWIVCLPLWEAFFEQSILRSHSSYKSFVNNLHFDEYAPLRKNTSN